MKNKSILLVTVLLPGILAAQESFQETGGNQPSFLWIIIQSIFALALVIGGIVLVVWVLRQFMNRAQGSPSAQRTPEFRVLHQVDLTANHSLFAVRFFNDLLLLGEGENGMTLIHKYPDFREWDALEDNSPQVNQKFGQILKRAIGGTGTKSS
ncbi:MAG: flagellar biosynthetic protein FliO [Candidatus Marinimicrobia bacterium]|nr:flagellar biosynthetic protein FliO [Candidatus Neomarinimicrobiota bacterium]MCF7880512.1 flagellar biosynthetic protein FliO [Candidatus Neomarinimicrobiota bacterium]